MKGNPMNELFLGRVRVRAVVFAEKTEVVDHIPSKNNVARNFKI